MELNSSLKIFTIFWLLCNYFTYKNLWSYDFLKKGR